MSESVPCGRSRQLSPPLFADYFGLKKNDPKAIKEKIIELLRAQGGQSEINLWVGKKTIAVTPMYESLMKMCGIKDYFVVNAYCPSKEEISRLLEADVLIVTAGYLDTVKQHCDGEIPRVRSTTFGDLIEAISLISEELSDEVDPESVENTLRKIRETREKYVASAMLIEKKVKPATDMVSKIVNDLNIRISKEGILIAPDSGTSGEGVSIGKGAKILVPTHRSVEGDLLERVYQKYDSIIEGLKNFED